MDGFDEIIHQPTRLRIMAVLVTLDPGQKVDFTYLRDLLRVSDGNLGAHLGKLEEARYVKVEKAFVLRKPRTYLSPTHRGRAAFQDHVATLGRIVNGEEGGGRGERQ